MTYLAWVASLPYGPLYNEIIHITCKQTDINIYICTNRYDIPKISSNAKLLKVAIIVILFRAKSNEGKYTKPN